MNICWVCNKQTHWGRTSDQEFICLGCILIIGAKLVGLAFVAPFVLLWQTLEKHNSRLLEIVCAVVFGILLFILLMVFLPQDMIAKHSKKTKSNIEIE